MLDVVVVAMAVFLPALAWSISLAHKGRKYELHKRVQMTLAVLLLTAVGLFEADMRINGWRERAALSPHFPTIVDISLYIHLVFAVTTFCLWCAVLFQAWRHFPRPAAPSSHSQWHKRYAWCGAIDMLLTVLSGWVFYYLAFVAR